MNRIINILIPFLFPFFCISQVIRIDDKIIMTGDTQDKRKISNVASAQNEADAINDRMLLSGAINFASATGSADTIHLSIFPLPLAINKGLLLTFVSPISNNGKVVADINGNGIYFELTKKISESLDSANISAGQVVSMVYDGSNFQIYSEIKKSCPQGFVKANNEFCITPLEPAPVYFWSAIKNCGNKNARVCSWGEWYYACLKSDELGMSNMTDNFEWLDAGGNSLAISSNTGLMAGDSTCVKINSSITDSTVNTSQANPKPYRCCYSLIK
jgi:hypothetical protein